MPSSSGRLAARILSFAALATALPACAQDTSLLRYGGADRSRRLIAAAQKEGSFALYTSFAEKDLPPLTDLTEKKYGGKVKLWRARSEKVLQRTLPEAAAKRHEADAIHSSALEMQTLHREKILQAAASPYSTELIAAARAAAGIRSSATWSRRAKCRARARSTAGGRTRPGARARGAAGSCWGRRSRA